MTYLDLDLKDRKLKSKTQIKFACAKDWNEFLKTMLNKYPDKPSEWLQNLSPITLKQMIKDSLIETY